MDLGIEIKNSKIIIKWVDVKADYYKVFYRNNDVFYECAKVKNALQIRLSLIPFGESECFVQAVKNGVVIDQSQKRKFNFDTIDVITKSEGDNVKFFYSKYPDVQGYRLYKSEEEAGFNGVKNSDTEYISTEFSENAEYKIKPYIKGENGKEFVASSPVFKAERNVFKSVTIYKSFNYNLFLSWNFEGEVDGFLVYPQNSDFPVFESEDGLCHHLEITDFKGSTKFIVKAFVNTPTGKLIIAESEPVTLSIRKYEKPDVSLIIPAYNAKDYIARSIDSALASDFQNLEIIIVNDGSTDDTQKIIDWYDKNYENVVSFQKENGGVADARNYGIERARGEYIAFMDNDDLIRPDMISSLYKSITKNNCDVAISPLYRFTDKGYTIHCKLPFIPDVPYDIDKYMDIMYTPGYYNCAIWNKLYRASIVKEHPLGKGMRYEDVSWTPCILSYTEKFCFVNKPFYEWDRKTRPETFGDFLAKKPEDELFEHRKQAMIFFMQNGNPTRREYMKTIAKRRLSRYANNSTNTAYQELIGQIDAGKYPN